MVTIRAWEESGHRGLSIMEMATADAWHDALEWRPKDHQGNSFLIYDEGGDRMVKLDRHGTRAQINGAYELDVLLDIATSLQPASKNPPPLTN